MPQPDRLFGAVVCFSTQASALDLNQYQTSHTPTQLDLGPPVPDLSPLFWGEGSPTKVDVQIKTETLVLTSLLEDLVIADTRNSQTNQPVTP